MDGQAALGSILQLGRTYGLELTSVIVLAVIFIFMLQKVVQTASEKAVERAFAREAKIFELVAGRRSSFVQKLQADRWEAINDFIIRIERITTNIQLGLERASKCLTCSKRNQMTQRYCSVDGRI